MVALQIRDVPDDVRNILTERARAQGKSLQAYLRDLVTRDAATPTLQESLARMRDTASLDLTDTDVSALIGEGRERR